MLNSIAGLHVLPDIVNLIVGTIWDQMRTEAGFWGGVPPPSMSYNFRNVHIDQTTTIQVNCAFMDQGNAQNLINTLANGLSNRIGLNDAGQIQPTKRKIDQVPKIVERDGQCFFGTLGWKSFITDEALHPTDTRRTCYF